MRSLPPCARRWGAAGVGPALRHLHRTPDRRREEVAGLRVALPRPRPDAHRGRGRRRAGRRGRRRRRGLRRRAAHRITPTRHIFGAVDGVSLQMLTTARGGPNGLTCGYPPQRQSACGCFERDRTTSCRLSGMSIAAIPGASLDAGWPLDQPFTMAQATSWRSESRCRLHDSPVKASFAGSSKGSTSMRRCPDSLQLRSSALSSGRPRVGHRDRPYGGAGSTASPYWPQMIIFALLPCPCSSCPATHESRTRGNVGGERTLLDTDIELVGGIRVTTPLRTALDLGRLTSTG